MKEGEKYYRYEYRYDRLELEEYVVVKLTPKGGWLSRVLWEENLPPKHWQGAKHRRTFAYTDKEKALLSFAHRKRSYLEHLQRRTNLAKQALRKAVLLMGEGEKCR